MTDHPILFKPEMVRALLDGRKTQTRRIAGLDDVNKNTAAWALNNVGPLGYMAKKSVRGKFGATFESRTLEKGSVLVCPQLLACAPGDRLWVKETWRPHSLGETNWNIEISYPADGQWITIYDGEMGESDWNWPKAADRGNVSPLFMPRWASRITLTVTDVRVERLQDISDADAIAEGIQPSEEFADSYLTPNGNYAVPRVAFKRLWERINAKPRSVKGRDGKGISHYVSYPWDGEPRTETYRGKPHHIHPNPWVAAYKFDVIKGNIDRIGGAA